MTDREPIPIERPQKIESALNTYEPGSENLVQIHDLDHQMAKIESELGEEPDVSVRLKELRGCIARLKYARDKKSPEAEQKALESARSANSALQGVIAGKERD